MSKYNVGDIVSLTGSNQKGVYPYTIVRVNDITPVKRKTPVYSYTVKPHILSEEKGEKNVAVDKIEKLVKKAPIVNSAAAAEAAAVSEMYHVAKVRETSRIEHLPSNSAAAVADEAEDPTPPSGGARKSKKARKVRKSKKARRSKKSKKARKSKKATKTRRLF